MKPLKTIILPILLATVWISLNEFVRNEYVLKPYWTEHYQSLGLSFPDAPINGAIWGFWSLLFAVAVFVISRRFAPLTTFLLSWGVGFVLMWVVVGNLGVLPMAILPFAVPWSLAEAFGAAWTIHALGKPPGQE